MIKNAYCLNPSPPISLVNYVCSSGSFSGNEGFASIINKQRRNKPAPKGQTVRFRNARKFKNLSIENENVALLLQCSSNCRSKSSADDRQVIWDEFRLITDLDPRCQYIAELIDIKSPARMSKARKKPRDVVVFYHLKRDFSASNRLCKKCFITLFRLSLAKVNLIVKKKINRGQSNQIKNFQGKKAPVNKISDSDIEQVGLFLLSIPSYESHYGRADSEKKYLPSHHTKMSIFEDFKNSFPNNRANYSKFCAVFKHLNLSIKMKATDTCQKCDSLAVSIRVTADDDAKKSFIAEQKNHWDAWKAAIEEKKKDALIGKTNTSVKIVAYDFQQSLPTPNLTTSVAFYSRQLWTQNLTIIDLASGQSTHNMWSEAMAAKGANEVGSCICNYAMKLPSHVKHLIKFSDRCPGQNLNLHVVIADLVLLQDSSSLTTIDSKFLVSGHTHMEVDSAHATIERKKKKSKKPIAVPNDWMDFVESASLKFSVNRMTHKDFYEYSALLRDTLVYRKKDVKKNDWKFSKIQWIRVRKDEPYSFFFKTSYDENEPFKEVSLLRKGNTGKAKLQPKKIHQSDDSRPIQKEKKADLLSLLKYIDNNYHDFYKRLKVDE